MIWKGSTFVQHADELLFTPGQGTTRTRRMEGTAAQMIPRAVSLRNLGWQARVGRSGESPIWQVEAVVQDEPEANDPTVDTHELHGNIANPSNLTSPFLLSQFVDGGAGKSKEEKAGWIGKTCADFLSGTLKTFAQVKNQIIDPDGPFGALIQAETDLAFAVVSDCIQGVNHYLQFQFVYRHTFTYGYLVNRRAGIANVGKIHTSAQLIASENIPGEEAADITDMGGEWMKLFPQKINQLNQRRQLTREYWWAADWKRNYYQNAT